MGAFNNLPPTPNSLKNHPQIAYCFAGVADDGLPKPVSWFQTGWDFAKPILDNGGVVLSHCAAGVNRGPSVAYFLLRAHWGMTGDNAFALLKAQRPSSTSPTEPTPTRRSSLSSSGANFARHRPREAMHTDPRGSGRRSRN